MVKSLFFLLLIGLISSTEASNQSTYTTLQTSFLSKSKERFLINLTSNVTVVFVTCCQRYQLLKDSLVNFNMNNDYPVRQIIVANDGPITKKLLQIISEVPPLTLLATNQKVGQILTIDKAYGLVKTPYVYFSEDDMILVMKGVIKMNVETLQEDPKILQVRNSHGFNTDYPKKGKYIDPQYGPSGFSFHPTVNRMSVYRQLQKGYAGLTGNCSYGTGAGLAQAYINNHYKSLNWLCVQSQWQSIRHGGDNKGNSRYLPQKYSQIIFCKIKNQLRSYQSIFIFFGGVILGVAVSFWFYKQKKALKSQQLQQEQEEINIKQNIKS